MQLLTYSAISKLHLCPCRYYWRYERGLIRNVERDEALHLGSVIHRGLEEWYRTGDESAALAVVADGRDEWARARAGAMLAGYLARYPGPEPWHVVSVESVLTDGVGPGGLPYGLPILNPATGHASRSFAFSGKVDLVAHDEDGPGIIDHKTAASVDGGYLERLWTDLQLALYAAHVRPAPKWAEYNVLLKPSLRPYQAGKRRPADETPEEYAARCAEWCARPEAYHRERVIVSPLRQRAVLRELWEATKTILRYRRRGYWPQHTGACWSWNRPCDYFPICRSGDNPMLVDNEYRSEPVHTEIREDVPAVPLPF